MLKFEMCAPQLFWFWLLSGERGFSCTESGVSFTEAQPGSTLTALCFEIAYSLLRKIVEREFQILTLMNFHEPLEIKCNFQRPSSSDSPLLRLETKTKMIDKSILQESSDYYMCTVHP